MTDEVSGSARTALRDATAVSHERLHHMPVFADLAAGRLDRARYVALLRRLYGFHLPAEVAIVRALGGVAFAPGMADWLRADLIRQDLVTLGQTAQDIGHVEMLDGLAPLDSSAWAIGWRYVVEGSTLGGRLLARRLDHILSKNVHSGRLFLLAGGDRHHTAWRELCTAIEREGSGSAGRAEMIAGAQDAFARFEGWFTEGSDAAAA